MWGSGGSGKRRLVNDDQFTLKMPTGPSSRVLRDIHRREMVAKREVQRYVACVAVAAAIARLTSTTEGLSSTSLGIPPYPLKYATKHNSL